MLDKSRSLGERSLHRADRHNVPPPIFLCGFSDVEGFDQNHLRQGRKEAGTPRLRSPREHGMGTPDNMPVEQTGRKTVCTKSGRKVQAPQRLDL